MPAFYAHHRFGKKVYERLNSDIKELIEKNYAQFAIGLQGPDIFFFYKAYKKNKVNEYGNKLHAQSARPFFLHALEVIDKKGRDSKEYAYLLGVICHYILDSECHPYVEEMIQVSGVQHLEIEEEFEKKLLKLDGEDPIGFEMAKLVPSDDETAQAIYPFYPGFDALTVKKSLMDLKLIKKLFTAPGAIKHASINTIMKMSGKHAYLKGLMNQKKDNLKCYESNEGLLHRFDKAIAVAVKMIASFDTTLTKHTRLDDRFNRTFE
ncbi:MAG: hypothetical protein EOM50_04055 [Erysipelotrichia bacterium]|nr:hypothetical protein [Erysipelotrichia bacterium]NCC54544.1 hypothetical protein [Erysipelotrichia bacterium]